MKRFRVEWEYEESMFSAELPVEEVGAKVTELLAGGVWWIEITELES